MATLTAELTLVEDGWIQAQLVDLPAVITATPVRELVTEQLADALLEYLIAHGALEALDAESAKDATRVPLRLTLAADPALILPQP